MTLSSALLLSEGHCPFLGIVSHAVDHQPAIAPRNVTSTSAAFPYKHYSSQLIKKSTQTIMADNDVATKAPESDAQENVIPGDTPAQTGPTLGEHCTTDRPTRK